MRAAAAVVLAAATTGVFAAPRHIPAAPWMRQCAATGPARAVDLDFVDGQVPAGMTCWGAGARLGVAPVDGGPALALNYLAVRTTTAGLTLGGLSLPPDARRLQMEMRTSAPTSLAIDLHEEGGARYQAFYRLAAGGWQVVDMSLSDFWLAENSVDQDGRLDPDQVRTMMVMDLANLPGQAGMALGLKDGPQEMDWRHIYLGPGAATPRGRVAADRAALDDFWREPLALLPIGGPDLAVVDPGGRRELEVRYEFGGNRWAGFLLGVAHLPVERVAAVAFRAHAEPPVSLHIVLEQRDGAKFEATIRAPAGAAQEILLPLRAFGCTAHGRGAGQALDMGEVRVLIIVADTFSTRLRRGQPGRYWIGAPGFALANEP